MQYLRTRWKNTGGTKCYYDYIEFFCILHKDKNYLNSKTFQDLCGANDSCSLVIYQFYKQIEGTTPIRGSNLSH